MNLFDISIPFIGFIALIFALVHKNKNKRWLVMEDPTIEKYDPVLDGYIKITKEHAELCNKLRLNPELEPVLSLKIKRLSGIIREYDNALKRQKKYNKNTFNMAVSKKQRQIIHDKFGGKCAYCGCELVKGWHVDEILPIRRNIIYDYNKRKFVPDGTCMHPERLHIDNQYPACASCNINKHSMSLEDFRNSITGFMKHLNESSTQYKIAKRYGLIYETIKPIIFYFEEYEKTINTNI